MTHDLASREQKTLLGVLFVFCVLQPVFAQSASRLEPEELVDARIREEAALRGRQSTLSQTLHPGGFTEEDSDWLYDLRGTRRGRRRILLTGYWPPTNEMIRRFSPKVSQNPGGWIGGNWEGRGYDVYAFFPEFSDRSCTICGRGMGDLEVDYQDTSVDFWRIANAVQPIALVTFSRGLNNRSWEVETNQYNRGSWVPDYFTPIQPTPAPPDGRVPAGFLRTSTLPTMAIADAVNASVLNVNARVCTTADGGGFLSEFIAYHGVWYQAIHNQPSDPVYCVAAGHVHVGGRVGPAAADATKVTIRVVIDHVNNVIGPPGGSIEACGVGGVDSGCGSPQRVLFVNGSAGGRARTVNVDLGASLSVTVRESPSRRGDGLVSRVCLYAFPGLASPADTVAVPLGLGSMCFGPFSIATQPPLLIWNSIGSNSKLGRHNAAGAPPLIPDAGEAVLLNRTGGARFPITVTLQGVIEDDCGQGSIPYSITNGVALIVD